MVITLEGVGKSFDGRSLFRDLTATLAGRVSISGPSGCGKTTLLRLIAGLDTPDAGVIRRPAGTRFACHFQEDRLLPWYTARENLALTSGDAEAWLRRIRLGDAGDRYPDELSGGMRRRLSLARALAFPSDVLLLDEPLRELDAPTAQAMLRLIDQSAGERLMVLVTHDPAQARALGCREIPVFAQANSAAD